MSLLDNPFVSIRGVSTPSGLEGLYSIAMWYNDVGMYNNVDDPYIYLIIDPYNSLGYGEFPTWTLFDWFYAKTFFISDSDDINNVPENAAWTSVPPAQQEAGGLVVKGIGFSGVQVEISTADELQAIAQSSTFLAYNYIQTADIDLDIEPYNVGAGFIPIGTEASPFTGKYDGRNHKITNLYINRPSTTYVGLFGNCSGMISRIRLVDATISGKARVGSLAGQYDNHLQSIEADSCSSENCSVTGNDRLCGLLMGNVGAGTGISVIKNCWATGDLVINVVSADQLVIAGLFSGTCNFALKKNCWAKGTITVNTNNYNSYEYGAFCGRVNGLASSANFQDCFTILDSITVNGSGNIVDSGGFVGTQVYNAMAFTRCYAVHPEETAATGFINNVAKAGTPDPPVITACYYQGTVRSPDGGEATYATGQSESSMKDKNTYEGWNFSTLWDIDPLVNDGYPYLNPRGGGFVLTQDMLEAMGFLDDE